METEIINSVIFAGFIGKVLGSVAGSVVSGIFNSKEADKNRDFQEELSNTSYQRAVKDMRAAGINPILAAKLGGASTPAGAMAKWPDFGTSISSAISAGAQQTQAETAEAKAQEEMEQIKTQAALNEKQMEMLDKQMEEKTANIQNILARTDMTKALTELPKLISEIIRSLRDLGSIGSESALKEGIENVLRIRIQKDAGDYPPIQWNPERQLQ